MILSKTAKKAALLSAIVISLLAISACHLVNSSPVKKNPTLRDHVTFLADPRLEGRNSGTPGNEEAADYEVSYFKAFGLKPLGNSYKQTFEIATGVRLLENNTLTLTHNGTAQTLEVNKDFVPLGLSGNTTDLQGELLFTGFGITQKNGDYDDYRGVDPAGKIVVMFRGTIDSENPHSKYTDYAPLRYKLSNARAQEAAAVIVVSPAAMTDTLMELNLPIGGVNLGIPALHVRRAVVESLLPEGTSLDEIETLINQQRQPQKIALNATAKLSVNLEFIFKKTANVIGVVEGTNPELANEYIVVGAHFDHIGFGEFGSRYNGNEHLVHPGADDNASGSAGMLEIARRISRSPLPRPVIFMGFSGEERGLLGSAHYTREPLVPLAETVTMINMDMIGRLREKSLTITGTGTSSKWESLVDSLGAVYGLKISKSSGGYGSSDHSSFFSQDIPVINFFTGLHDQYHHPDDKIGTLNYAGMDTIVNMVEATLNYVGHMGEKPDFIKPKEDPGGRRMAFRVTVGTIPDYADNPKGMRITGVKSDSPAEKGSLVGGDIITQFGKQKIANIYDYTYALGVYSPGDTVVVKVLRGETDTPMDLTLVLEGRQNSGQ